jgi:hypothetical protein
VGPCIHHFAIEVDDLQQAEQQIKSCGCEIVSDPGVIDQVSRARWDGRGTRAGGAIQATAEQMTGARLAPGVSEP